MEHIETNLMSCELCGVKTTTLVNKEQMLVCSTCETAAFIEPDGS